MSQPRPKHRTRWSLFIYVCTYIYINIFFCNVYLALYSALHINKFNETDENKFRITFNYIFYRIRSPLKNCNTWSVTFVKLNFFPQTGPLRQKRLVRSGVNFGWKSLKNLVAEHFQPPTPRFYLLTYTQSTFSLHNTTRPGWYGDVVEVVYIMVCRRVSLGIFPFTPKPGGFPPPPTFSPHTWARFAKTSAKNTKIRIFFLIRFCQLSPFKMRCVHQSICPVQWPILN